MAILPGRLPLEMDRLEKGGERRFQHPQLGELLYRQVNFRVANRPDLKLVTLMPGAMAPG